MKTMENFGYLGFKAGENRYTYPRPTEDKVSQFFARLRELADYIVLDCVSEPGNLFSEIAQIEADRQVRIIAPDLKCMVYHLSERNQNPDARMMTVLNEKERDIILPSGEVSANFGKVDFSLPYSYALKKQVYTGTLSERLSDLKYRKSMKTVARAVIS